MRKRLSRLETGRSFFVVVCLFAATAPSCGDDDGTGGDGDAGTDTDTDTDADTDTETHLDGGCDDAGTSVEVELPYVFGKNDADGDPLVDFVFSVDAPRWIDARGEEPPNTFYVTPPPMLLLDPDCEVYTDLGQDPYDQECDQTIQAEHGGPVYLDRAGSWRLRVFMQTNEVSGTIGAAFADPLLGFATVEPDSAEAPNAPFDDTIASGAFSYASADFGVVLEEGDADWIRAPVYDTRWPIAILNEGAVPGRTAPTRVTAIDPNDDETLLTDDLFALPYLFYWSTVQGEHLLRFENTEPSVGGVSWFVGSITVYGEEFDPTYGGTEVEPNDTMATAQPLVASGDAPELLYEVAGNLDPAGGDDWFLFTVPEGAQYTTIYARDVFDFFSPTYLDLAIIYDDMLIPISSADDVFCSGYAFIDLPAGDYRIQPGSPPSGYYSLNIVTSEISPWQWE